MLAIVYEKVKYIEIFPFSIVVSLSMRTFSKAYSSKPRMIMKMCVNYTNKYQYEMMSTRRSGGINKMLHLFTKSTRFELLSLFFIETDDEWRIFLTKIHV